VVFEHGVRAGEVLKAPGTIGTTTLGLQRITSAGEDTYVPGTLSERAYKRAALADEEGHIKVELTQQLAAKDTISDRIPESPVRRHKFTKHQVQRFIEAKTTSQPKNKSDPFFVRTF
jgi:hypothetical protein